MFSLQGHVSSIIMQVFSAFEKINISGLRWDITIQDGITNLSVKSDINLQSGDTCRRPVLGFFMDFLVFVRGLTKFICCCRLSRKIGGMESS